MGQAIAVSASGVGVIYGFTTCATELCNTIQPPPVIQAPLPPPSPPQLMPPPPYPPFPPEPPAAPATAFVYTFEDLRAAVASPTVLKIVVMSARITLQGQALNITRPQAGPGVYRDVSIESGASFSCPPDLDLSRLPPAARPARCPPVIDAAGLSGIFVMEFGNLVLKNLVLMNGRRTDGGAGGCVALSLAVTLGRLDNVTFANCQSSGVRCLSQMPAGHCAASAHVIPTVSLFLTFGQPPHARLRSKEVQSSPGRTSRPSGARSLTAQRRWTAGRSDPTSSLPNARTLSAAEPPGTAGQSRATS